MQEMQGSLMGINIGELNGVLFDNPGERKHLRKHYQHLKMVECLGDKYYESYPSNPTFFIQNGRSPMPYQVCKEHFFGK